MNYDKKSYKIIFEKIKDAQTELFQLEKEWIELEEKNLD